MEYQGYKQLTLNDQDITDLYNGKYFSKDFLENEYLILEDSNHSVIDYFRATASNFERLNYPMVESNLLGTLKPRNPQQYCALDLLKNKSIPIKLITGRFGSGKTLLCIGAALDTLQRGDVQKIVFVRNNIAVKDTEPLGALPGNEIEKMLPFVLPIADHCGGVEAVYDLIEAKKLEIIPLGYLRGRSIRNSIIYAMESENLTIPQIQLIMGRVDVGSQLWLDGDFKQRDKIVFERSQGLERMIERLKGNPYFGFVHLVKSERSPVAALADLLD